MRISTRARYALRLMIDLADHEAVRTPVILRDVAKRQQISKRYLEQLATSLKNANLVATAQGRGGGYMLARQPEEIRVREIITAGIGPINVVRCVRDPETCSRAEDCPSRAMWVQVNDRINEVFGAVTLSDLREGRLGQDATEANGTAPCSEPSKPGASS